MINPQLLTALESFFANGPDVKFPGEKEQAENFAPLGSELKSMLPDWYYELLLRYPMDGLTIDFIVREDHELSIEFVGFEVMQDEYYDHYPGCAIASLGFICIGEDPTGGGDPYFISIHEGNNPPVYQVYHDAGDVGEEILAEGREKVVDRLSDLFRIVG